MYLSEVFAIMDLHQSMTLLRITLCRKSRCFKQAVPGHW